MSGPAEQWAWQLQDERLSLSEKFVLVSGAKGVLRRRVRRVAVGQHHRGTLPLHAPFRAARVETLAGAGLLARG